jgi:predicted PurR-regulated permease PerM
VILDGGGFGRSIVGGAGLAIGVALVAALVFVGLAALNVLLLVFIAVILASGLQPFIAWIRGHLPIGRGPTILIVYGLFLAAVVGLAFVVVPAAVAQAERTIDSLPPFFDRARAWAATLHPATLASTVTGLIDAADRTLRPPASRPAGRRGRLTIRPSPRSSPC